MTPIHRNSRVWILVALGLAAASAARAQISSINSAVITPRVYNDIPTAVGTYINNYPSTIALVETNVWTTTPGAYADRDVWNFSNNGTSPYVLGANDFFSVSMTLNVSGSTTVDNEAGFIIQNLNGNFPGGDMQFIADPNSHFLGFFGGPGFWNSGISYTAGTTVTLGMMYFFDAANNADAMQFWVNAGSGNIYSPIEDDINNGTPENLAGDTFGGYYQIQTGGTNAPGSMGSGVFQNIQFGTVPEPSVLALVGLGILPLVWRLRRRA